MDTFGLFGRQFYGQIKGEGFVVLPSITALEISPIDKLSF
jgi:hypothetical protein